MKYVSFVMSKWKQSYKAYEMNLYKLLFMLDCPFSIYNFDK